MKAIERHRQSWQGKSDEWLFERLDNELKQKVEEIHRLLAENETLRQLMKNYTKDIGFWKDRHLMSIIKNGIRIGDIELVDGKITTSGIIGNNHYDNFVELIKGLQGLDIKIDEFYW